PWHHNNKYLCLSIFLTLLSQAALAETPVAIEPSNVQVEPQNSTEFTEDIKKEAIRQGMGSADELKKVENSVVQPTVPDSMQMLQQQQTALKNLPEFAPIEFDDLEDLPTVQVDQGMANDIYQVAEQAKAEAQAYRSGQTTELVLSDATQQEMAEINQAPVNVDQLMQSIQADSKISVEANTEGNTLDFGMSAEEQIAKEPNFFKRMLYKIRPPRALDTAKVPRINADVEIINAKYEGEISNKAYQAALVNLKENIEGKVSSFTEESFEDFPSALPQLRTLSNQAAQAVGFYNAEFKFEKTSSNRVRIQVVPNNPVRIEEQNIEFSGAGQYLPQFQVIKVLPEQDVGDVLHHGLYESTKARINEAASNNGFFDSYWRLHDVKVEQPQNTADINLRYETGERYKLGGVEFVMSDPSKPLPIDLDVLQSLVTWEPGADYTFWRVNGLANNLTNSRYFNYSLVDAVR
ncbi:MAG: POTRA domain-containing protein, partial [Acinetobacter sp.]